MRSRTMPIIRLKKDAAPRIIAAPVIECWEEKSFRIMLEPFFSSHDENNNDDNER